jgi:CheY-like chemotaxis protein
MRQTAILCVDDDKLVLDSLKLQIGRHYDHAYVLEFAEDALEGLELIAEMAAENIRTVLIISDWMMPGMNGDEFLIKVKQQYPHIQTMILTGQADEVKANELRALNISNALLGKPWSEQELLQAINSLLPSN